MSSNEPPADATPPAGDPYGQTPPPADGAGHYGAPPPPAPAPSEAFGGVGGPGGLAERFVARLIDGVIVAIVVVIVYSVLNAATGYWTANLIGGVVGAALYLGYYGYFESERGQTIGKQVMKLKTVGPDGASNPTMNEAIKRNIWNAFSIVPCLGSLAALVSVIVIAVNISSDPQRQHAFDRFAGGTRVIKVG